MHPRECPYKEMPFCCPEVKKAEQAARKDEREPFVSFLKTASLKRGEMVDLMRRNHLKIDILADPMQKLAFTFFSEIGELSHMADVILEEEQR